MHRVKKTYQIVGTPKVKLSKDEKPKEDEIPEEDIDLVVEQNGKNAEAAKKALKESKGDIAEAILKLTE